MKLENKTKVESENKLESIVGAKISTLEKIKNWFNGFGYPYEANKIPVNPPCGFSYKPPVTYSGQGGRH